MCVVLSAWVKNDGLATNRGERRCPVRRIVEVRGRQRRDFHSISVKFEYFGGSRIARLVPAWQPAVRVATITGREARDVVSRVELFTE